MYVSTNNFKVALDETINEMFSKVPLNFINGLNKLGLNMFLSAKIDSLLNTIVSDNGKINLDNLEKYSKELIPMVTANVIPAMGTSYRISEGDIQNFFSKLKQLGENE